MSKAILVIEMPTCCKECPFYDTEILPSCWSAMNFKGRTIVYDETEKQHFCPLKPLPKKYIKIAQIENGKVINTEDMQFMAGYNKCLDTILGEEE